MRTLLIVAGVIVVLAGLLWWYLGRAVDRDQDKLGISWWGTQHGFRYTQGTDELLGYFRGLPFDRGTSADVQDLLVGQLAGRPAMVLQFSWYHSPDLPQDANTGTSGLRSGVCAAVVIELPAPVPELTVRQESHLDRDISFESGQFNERFKVDSEHAKFAHDVVNPQLMAFLLDAGRPYSFRLDGPMLVVWRDGKVDEAVELGRMADFATTVLGHIPPFVFGQGWTPGPEQTQVGVSAIPPSAHGTAPTGAIAFLQRFDHRGREITRYEHFSELWGQRGWAVVVKIDVPTVWPVCMVVPKVLAPPTIQPRFDDEYLTGDAAFDTLFATGTPRPDFARALLTPEFTHWLADDPRTARTRLVFQSDVVTPEVDGVPAQEWRGQLALMSHGCLADQLPADHLTDLACDILDRLPATALAFHRDRTTG